MAIQKLQKGAREEAEEDGLLFVQYLQAMMTKTLTDFKRIRGQIETDNLHPQSVFEVNDDGLGNSIVRNFFFVSKQCSRCLLKGRETVVL